MKRLNSKTKFLIRVVLTVLLFAAAMVAERVGKTSFWQISSIVLYVFAYITAAYDVLWKSVTNICHGVIFDENFLMTVASVGAFVLQEYPEAVVVMLLYQIGEFLQTLAVNKSRKSISALLEILPEYAFVEREGEIVRLDPHDVEVGEIIVIKAGDKVALDCVVVEGKSVVNTAALTGESVPRKVEVGSEVLSGTVNESGVLRAKVVRPFGESAASKIIELVENASDRKANSERFITKFARFYTPTVVFLAIALAIVPPLATGGDWSTWVYRALSFLVVSCPCALVISVPLSFFGGIGGISKRGILVKGGNFIEALAKTETAVFDKTGTLTEGKFAVDEWIPAQGGTQEDALLAAYAESMSTHPVARAIWQYGGEKTTRSLSDANEIAGEGVSVVVDGRRVLAGNGKLLDRFGVKYQLPHATGTIVLVAVDGAFVGSFSVKDKVKPASKQAVALLRRSGVKKTFMLSGDNRDVAEEVSQKVGLDGCEAELLPQDKVASLEKLLAEKRKNKTLVYAGDGINDAPCLARADIGVAMGGIGADSAIEAADVVVVDDNPVKVAEAVCLSQKVTGIAIQNVVFSIAIKVVVMVLTALGVTSMWLAVFADVGVTLIAVLNALRTLRLESTSKRFLQKYDQKDFSPQNQPTA